MMQEYELPLWADDDSCVETCEEQDLYLLEEEAVKEEMTERGISFTRDFYNYIEQNDDENARAIKEKINLILWGERL